MPRVPLDAVATALWQVELRRRTPHLRLRCLVAWWRIEGHIATSATSRATAAALARLVATCAGCQLSYDTVATDYGVDADQVRASATDLWPMLGFDRERGW